MSIVLIVAGAALLACAAVCVVAWLMNDRSSRQVERAVGELARRRQRP